MSEYPQAPQASWPPIGEASVPPPVPIPARNTPLSWRNYRQNYTPPFPIAAANNPQHGNVYEANDPPHRRGILSGTLRSLKRVLSERMAHPESDGHGKVKITVTFETYGEM
ncbi:hypothetical protein BGY98DRAFT_1008223 [Russula aff. rugulosa BPL654]|nr:hypothetical protein BGY98DRAFT_1008223 [Russula aff. rugulosa BPL654]